MLEYVLKHGTKPLILDADGLNTISRYQMEIDYPYGVIMTPHLMEGARLLSKEIDEVKRISARRQKKLPAAIMPLLF